MHMAMAMSSCSKHSPSLPSPTISFSSYSSKSYLKLPNYGTPHSSSNHTFITIQEDAFAVEERESDLEREYNDATTRRQRRRLRRMRSILERINNDDGVAFVDRNSRKSRFMTPKEEARFSWYLKERARIEAVRKEVVAEMGGEELPLSQWAKAAGISQRKLDRILWNGRESEERIRSCYHGLVVSIASSYQGKGLSMQDLTQEGSIGLLRGAIKFNPERGYKLSTYAYWWIRQSITRAVANKSRIIRLPGSISELIPKICEASNALSTRLKRAPTYEEIAESIDVKPSNVKLAIERNKSVISLDQAMTSRGYMSLQDIIAGPEEMTPEVMTKKGLMKRETRKLLECLSDREAHILILHYGLKGDSPWSFEEIGRLLELSRERVRQINSAALSKLMEMSNINDLNYFI
ncbi:hypothetical protein ACS0TY_019979 [Phlomoides rotata]